MMRMLRWLPALAALVLLLLLVTAPARLLGHLISPQMLAVSGFSGTIWSGRVASAAVPVAGGRFQLGVLQWQLRPLSLLILAPRLQINTRWGQQRVDAQISVGVTGKVRLSDASVTVPAELARHWLPVQLHGNLNLQTEKLVFVDRQPVAGGGRLVWQQAGWSGGGAPQPLGDYVLEFEVVAAGEVDADIITLAGPVNVEGGAKLYPDRYTVDAQLSNPEGLSRELSNALRLIATPTDSGFDIKLNTAL